MFAKPKVQPLSLLKGIANIIKDAMTAGWASLPADIIDTISAVKIDDKPEMVGWKLISRSLADSLVTLITETNPVYFKDDIELEPLDKSLNEYLENKDYFIDANFFKTPQNFGLINDIKPSLKEYLEIFDLKDIESSNILERLNSYFVFSLINEWRKNVRYYSILKEILETPFDGVEKKESEWNIYRNFIETQVHKPIFSETFCLSQIYIPLRAYYKMKLKKEDYSKDDLADNLGKKYDKYKRIVIDLESYLLEWLDKGDKSDSIRIIRGGPGYGKSSFLKMLASKLSSMGKRVLFIPLHRFDIEDKLDISINNFLKYDKYFTHDPINDTEEKLIVLFDGLDELSMQGKALADIAQSFLREVERTVTNYNGRKLKIQTIISGRDVIIQQNESDFRNDGQILRLLPYYLNKDEKKGLEDIYNLLKQDQRNDWWQKYGKVNGENYEGIPKELLTEEIDEITAQPLLNFLVALSYVRRKIEFSQNTNLNEIYNDLLNAVYERGYSDGKKLKAICNMEHEHFCIMLEEIALSAWHGTGRTTTVKEIKNHFESSGLIQLLNKFVAEAEKGVVSLLAAFYFRQAGQSVDGMQTFEFTHKSFGEYLTSKKIVRQLVTIYEQLERNENDILNRDGWNYEQCLIEWIKLFADKEPDFDLIKFLRNELILSSKENPKLLSQLQVTIVKLINIMLLKGLPMEKLHPRLETFKRENEFAINSEKALFVIHSIIANQTVQVSKIYWPKLTSFGEVISRCIGQRKANDAFILQFLNHIDICSCILYIKDLYMSNLSHSNLENAVLTLANLEEANLEMADLNNAYLNRASLKGASLKGAILNGATLNGVDLEGAKLEGADLEGADLKEANLEGADLEGANLKGATLNRAKLEGATLKGATLKGAILKEADLEGANLEGADLEGANLVGANLDGTDIEGATLKGAKLVGANIVGAYLDGANLEGTDLEGANLNRAKLVGATLKGATLKGANLKGADLEGADLEGANLVGAYLDGADLVGANLDGTDLEGATLNGADLEGTNLKGANLNRAKLEGASLKEANLEGANLVGANLVGAYLDGANLEGTDLEGANLNRAKLEGATLKGADLEGANLEGANLEGANLEGANLEGAYLDGADLEGGNLEGTIL